MRTLKQFILFYFIEVIFILIVVFITTKQIVSTIKTPYLWLIPAIFSSLGLLIAASVYELKRRPETKKTKIFTIGYLVGFVCLVILFALGWFIKPTHGQGHSNETKNHDVMKYFVNDDEEYIRVAFKRLESEFKNPEDLKLHAFIVQKQDTTINQMPDTVYNVYFTYFLKTDSISKYFSKISVLHSMPTLRIYNQETKTNGEYIKLKYDDGKTEQLMQTLKESLRHRQDSTTQRFH